MKGTNGIQAMDLVARKMADGGKAAHAMLDEASASATAAGRNHLHLASLVAKAVQDMREATDWMAAQENFDDRFAGATNYLHAFARVLGAHYHLRAAATEDTPGPRFALAQYYITRILPEYTSALAEAKAGSAGVFSLSLEALGA